MHIVTIQFVLIMANQYFPSCP